MLPVSPLSPNESDLQGPPKFIPGALSSGDGGISDKEDESSKTKISKKKGKSDVSFTAASEGCLELMF